MSEKVWMNGQKKHRCGKKYCKHCVFLQHVWLEFPDSTVLICLWVIHQLGELFVPEDYFKKGMLK